MNNISKTYQVVKSTSIFQLCFYIFFVLFIVFIAIQAVIEGNINIFHTIGIAGIIVFSITYLIFITPYKIAISKDFIIFKSLVLKKTYCIQEITNIKTNINASMINFHFKIDGKKKRISILNRITDLYQLLYELKEENEDIGFYGC